MIGVSFSICCLIFLLILLVFYFSKERLKTLNNKLFKILLIVNITGVFIDVGGYVSFRLFGVGSVVNVLISKVYLLYYLIYVFCFMLYIYSVSVKNFKKAINYILLVFSLICLCVFILPIELHFDNNVGFSYGPSVNLAYAFGGCMIVFMIFCLIQNIKSIGYICVYYINNYYYFNSENSP